jgi:hypothetical protein
MTQQYGTVKCDVITFTSGTTGNETDVSITVSGLGNIQESGITVTGNITGDDITATGNLTVSGIGQFASGTEAAPGITFIGDTDLGFFTSAANTLNIATSGSTRATILENGYVGIGTTSPAGMLEIASADPRLRLTDNNTAAISGNCYLEFNGNDARAAAAYTNSDGLNIQADAGGGDNILFNTNGANERFRIDSTGRLLVGTSANIANLGGFSLQNAGTATKASFLQAVFANASGGPIHRFYHSRNATVNGHTIVQDGDEFGIIDFIGSDGTSPITGAEIKAEVDGTPSVDDMPGRLVFSTTADGSDSPTERLRIASDGKVGVGTSSPATLMHLSSATGSSSPTPTELRIATTTNASNWSTTDPWGQLSFYSADTSNGGAKIQAAIASTAVESFGGLCRLSLWTHNGTELNEQLSVLNNGNVGINTTSPNERFSVDVNGATNRAIEIYNADTTLSAGELVHAIRFTQNDTSNPNTTHASIETVTTGSQGLLNMVFKARNNTEYMRIDTNGNVGIGTSSPTQLIDLESTSGGRIAFTDTGSQRYSIGNSGSSLSIRDESDSADRITITNGGNVGIGTADPGTKLVVQEFSTFTLNSNTIDYTTFLQGGATQGNGNYGASLGFSRINSAGRTGAVIAAKQTTADADQIGIAFLTHQSASTNTDLVEQMLITHDGNVGIGTDDPDSLLHINRSNNNFIKLSTGTSAQNTEQGLLNYGRFISGTTPAFPGQLTSFIKEVRNESSAEFALLFGTTDDGSTDATEKMRILPSGGITFNGDTATANALDDYEEGTFTPTLEGATAYSQQTGMYTKVGDLVNFVARVQATAATGNTNILAIKGLPFTNKNVSATSYGGVYRIFGKLVNDANIDNLNLFIHLNSSNVTFYSGSVAIASNDANVILTENIIIRGSYFAA